MAEEIPHLTPNATPPAPPVDHEVLRTLVQQLRGAGVVDNQVTRTVSLSEADAKQMADTLEQLAQRLEAHPSSHRPPPAKP